MPGHFAKIASHEMCLVPLLFTAISTGTECTEAVAAGQRLTFCKDMHKKQKLYVYSVVSLCRIHHLLAEGTLPSTQPAKDRSVGYPGPSFTQPQYKHRFYYCRSYEGH